MAAALRTRACRRESCDSPPAKIARRFDKQEFSSRPKSLGCVNVSALVAVTSTLHLDANPPPPPINLALPRSSSLPLAAFAENIF